MTTLRAVLTEQPHPAPMHVSAFGMQLHGCFGQRATADLLQRFERAGGRTWPGLLEHAAERWAFSPVLAAAWALRNDSELALRHARDQLAALG